MPPQNPITHRKTDASDPRGWPTTRRVIPLLLRRHLPASTQPRLCKTKSPRRGTTTRRESRTHVKIRQNYACAFDRTTQPPPRRSPRGSDDARGNERRAARVRRRAPLAVGIEASPARSASGAPTPAKRRDFRTARVRLAQERAELAQLGPSGMPQKTAVPPKTYADKAPRMIRAIRSVSAAAKRGSR